MRLNKFLAQSGVASRRKSDELIQMATTEVNGKVCLDPAYNVSPEDKVCFDGKHYHANYFPDVGELRLVCVFNVKK